MSTHTMPSKRAKFHVRRHRRALLVEIVGLFNWDTGRQLRELFRLASDVAPFDRVLVDVRGAVILLIGAELALYQAESAADPSVTRPYAVLLLPEQAPTTLAHCARMAELGRVLVPFLDPAQALEWACLPASFLPEQSTQPERRAMPWLAPPTAAPHP
jgi:hypothetical protein